MEIIIITIIKKNIRNPKRRPNKNDAHLHITCVFTQINWSKSPGSNIGMQSIEYSNGTFHLLQQSSYFTISINVRIFFSSPKWDVPVINQMLKLITFMIDSFIINSGAETNQSNSIEIEKGINLIPVWNRFWGELLLSFASNGFKYRYAVAGCIFTG